MTPTRKPLSAFVQALVHQVGSSGPMREELARSQLNLQLCFPSSISKNGFTDFSVAKVLRASMSSTQTGHIRQKFAAHLVSELLVWLPLIDEEEPRRAIEALQMLRTVLELENPERDWNLAHATAVEAKESFGTEGRLQTACRAACEAAELIAGAFVDLSSCVANLDQAAWKVTFATQNICLTFQDEFWDIARIALN